MSFEDDDFYRYMYNPPASDLRRIRGIILGLGHENPITNRYDRQAIVAMGVDNGEGRSSHVLFGLADSFPGRELLIVNTSSASSYGRRVSTGAPLEQDDAEFLRKVTSQIFGRKDLKSIPADAKRRLS